MANSDSFYSLGKALEAIGRPVIILTEGGEKVEVLTSSARDILSLNDPLPFPFQRLPFWLKKQLSPLPDAAAGDNVLHYRLDTPSVQRHLQITVSQLKNGSTMVILDDFADPALTHQNIRQLIEGVSTATGEAFFRSMVQHLVLALEADHALIAEFTDSSRQTARTVAFCVDGAIAENCEFALPGTPCERVVAEGLQCYPNNVQTEFPHELRAVRLGVVAYYGVPLKDAGGQVIGLMSVMGRRPLRDSRGAVAMLQVFAARAASELEHQYAAEAKQEQLHFLQAILDAIPNPIFFKDLEGRYLGCNTALSKTTGVPLDHFIGRKVFDVAPAERAGLCHREDQEVFSRRVVRTYETSMQYADGRRREVVFFKAPFYHRDSRLRGLVGVIHDVTERKEAEERYRILFEQSPDAILILDPETRRPIQFNPRMPDLLGYTPEEFAALQLDDPRVCPQPAGCRKKSGELLSERRQDEFECLFLTKEGAEVEALIRARPIEIDGRHALHMIIRDITQKKRAEEALRQSREFSDTVLATMNDAAAIMDTIHFRVVWANKIFLEEYNLTVEEAIGRHCYDITRCQSAPGSKKSSNCPLQRTMATGQYALTEHVLPTDSGEEKYVEVATSPIWDNSGRIVQAVYVSRNVTGRKRAEKEIHRLAYYDTLTGLPNRALLRDRLHQEIARAQRSGRKVGVLFLDLDRFKRVNDSLGHAMGDGMLKMVAQRLVESVRQSDTVARVGGDEFVVLLPQVKRPEETAMVAEKIIAAAAIPFHLEGLDIFSSISIGLALFPEDGPDQDILLKNADIAMYQAKESGRNGFQFFSREMNRQVEERMVMETRLRKALERKEFFLVYQPQVEVATGRITGLEALIRWQQPELGLISPARFIPLAEETGLIIPIGEWVLEESCAQNRRWQADGMPEVTVAVNLSARQFKHPGLVDTIEKILHRTGLPSSCLELELTESILMDDPESARQILTRLKEMGIKLAVDDFGTGYSSLNYLKHFPLDRLKIDQSFVRDLIQDPNDARIVEAIIALAQGLRLSVVAEGVETPEQADFLQQRRCQEMQGYYFSRPCSASEIPDLFRHLPVRYRVCR